MSKNSKIGLLGLVAVALVVGGYFLLNKSDSNIPTPPKVEALVDKVSNETKTAVNDVAAKADARKDAAKKGAEDLVDPNMPKTSMTFVETEHDYGKVEQKTKNEYIFKFTNSGTNPLVIAKAKGTCGCTVPDYPKDPIMPGEDGEIKVEYSSRTSKGVQTKMVNIWANTQPEQTQLKISADVQAPAEGS